MKQFSKCFIALLLAFICFCRIAASQTLSPAITVNGNALVTTQLATRIGGEWFLPLLPIAEAVGAELRITGNPREVVVRRADGTEVSYNSRTGELRSRVVLLGRVNGFEHIQIVDSRQDLLFPLSGVVVLLGVNIYEDPGLNLIVIQTDSSRPRPHGDGSLLNFGAIDYNYGLATNGTNYAQFANVRSQILAGTVRTTEDLTLSALPGRSQPRLTQGWMRADLSAGRALVLGDQSTYAGIDVFTNAVRGGGFETLLNGLVSKFYVGRAVSTSFATVGPVGVLRYDTTLAGFNLRRTSRNREFALAGNHFDGPDRRGTTFGAAYRIANRMNQFRIQSSLGRFSGAASGVATGITITNTFDPTKYLTISGQVDRYGKNFLSIRDESRFTGQSNKTISVILRPTQSVNFSGSVSDRFFQLTDRRSRNYTYGANGWLPGVRALQWSAFKSTQTDDGSTADRFVLQQFSLSAPNLQNYSVYSYYSITGFRGELTRNVNVVVVNDRGRYGRFGFHEQVQLNSSHRFGVDWSLVRGARDGFIRAGIDRVASAKQSSGFAALIGMRIPLPGGHSLVFTFTRERDTKMLQLELGGHVNPRRELAADGSARSAVVVPARLTGRVYLDSDFNGLFDSKIDVPVAGVSIWLDDEKLLRTDTLGTSRFEGVTTNAHKVRAALDGLPADLVFAEPAERTLAVIPYDENVVNFRVVKAGRISGRATYLDYTADRDNPVEMPVPDLRIVASGDRDTFTEINGDFLLSDLPPGAYEVRVDEEMIPRPYVPEPASITVEVAPGKQSEGVRFRLVIPPRPVIEKSLPVQELSQ